MPSHRKLNDADTAVLKVLTQMRKPLSAYDILHKLQTVEHVSVKAPTQVYRSLQKLIEAGEAHRVASLNAFVACSCRHEVAPAGFLVCTECGEVAEFNAEGLAKVPLEGANGFRVQSMNVELSGVCNKCESSHEVPKH